MIRRGLTQWSIEHPSMKRLCCMTFVDKGASLLVAGNQDVMLKIETAKGNVVEKIPVTSEYTMIRHSRYICAATSTGCVDFLDPITLVVMKSWQAHTASISDMEVSGNSLITCGRSLRQNGPAMLETFAKVYDMKTMQQLPPIPFPAAAAFVQVHPRLSNTCVLGAQNGQLQVVDLVNPNTSNMVILGSFITHFLMSSSGNIWAVADQENMIHLWGSPNKPPTFNDAVQLPEYADEVEPVQQISFDDDLYETPHHPPCNTLMIISGPSVQSECLITVIVFCQLGETSSLGRLDIYRSSLTQILKGTCVPARDLGTLLQTLGSD